MNPLKPRPLGRSHSCPELGAPKKEKEPEVRITKPVWDEEIIDSFDAPPKLPTRAIESIKTASEYRTWLLKEAEFWRATQRVSPNPMEAKSTFLTYARKSIAQSQMLADQRSKALSALKEAESVLDKP